MAEIINELVALAQATAQSDSQRQALDKFVALGLPSYGSEEYQRTDLSSMLAGTWHSASYETTCTPTEAHPYFSLLSEEPTPMASLEHDPLAQFTKALASASGSFILPEGVRLDSPIEITTRYTATQRSLVPGRIVFRLGANAEATILLRSFNEGSAELLTLSSMEIYLARGAKLHLIDIDDSGSHAQRICTYNIHQEADSQAYLSVLSLSAGKTRNNYHCDLAGQGAHLELGGLVITGGTEHVDNYSYISHSVPHCTSSELFKYVLQDQSYGVFTGRILVAVDAQKTQAYQNNRNLLLSPEARMQAKPQLEIYADDVKCSHGMTTGQLSEDALFYMRQRGISTEEARRMLSIAFAEDVLQLLPSEALQDELRTRISTLIHT